MTMPNSTTRNSRLTRDLVAGDYTVEATTQEARQAGSFTLTVATDIGEAVPVTVRRLAESYDANVGELFSAGFNYAPAAAQVSVRSVAPSGLSLTLDDRSGSAGMAGTPKLAGLYKVILAFAQPGRTDTEEFTVSASCTEDHTQQSDRSCEPDPVCTIALGRVSSGTLGPKTGSWEDGCALPEGRRGRSGVFYAKHYTFSLNLDAEVTIDLGSGDQNTYLFLLRGHGPDGTLVDKDDDSGPRFDSRLSNLSLPAGDYTISASTHSRMRTGDFKVALRAVAPASTDLASSLRVTVGERLLVGFNVSPAGIALPRMKQATTPGLESVVKATDYVELDGESSLSLTADQAGEWTVTLLLEQPGRTDEHKVTITAVCPAGQAPSHTGDGQCVPVRPVPSGCTVSSLGGAATWWGSVYFEGPYTTYGASAAAACTSMSESGRRAAYWRFAVPAHQQPGGMPARVKLEVAKTPIIPVPLVPEAEAGYPTVTLWKYSAAGSQSMDRTVQRVASATSRQGAWHPALDVSLMSGDYLVEVAPTNSRIGLGRFGLKVLVPAPAKVHADVQKVGNTGLSGGGMSLAAFLDARGSLAKSASAERSDPSDPTSPTHPWLAFTADWCSVPSSWKIHLLQTIINSLSPVNAYLAHYIVQQPSFGGETVPFYYACMRHDFNWRNLHRVKHFFGLDTPGVWNGQIRGEADERFKQDLTMLCRANQYGQPSLPDSWNWTLSRTNRNICIKVANVFKRGVMTVAFGNISYSH